MNLKISNDRISREIYQDMRATTGWDMLNHDTVEKGLLNDLHSVSVYDGDEIVGIGRVIGDGAIYFYIQDIIVVPEYQGKGIGKIIMDDIERYIAEHANHNSFIGLMAAVGVQEFYYQFGYKERPDNKPGMFKMIKKL